MPLLKALQIAAGFFEQNANVSIFANKTEVNSRKAQRIIQRSSQSRFQQYLIGLKVEIWYYMTEISQNVNMLTSAI